MPNAAKDQYLEKLLQEQIIPKVVDLGMKNVFVAESSWEQQQQNARELPPGATVSPRPLCGKRVRARTRHHYGRLSIEQYRWPKDRLLSARAPKLCFVTEGPVAFQIADYIFHGSAGHGILLPAGTPNPDGTLPVLDTARPHHGACEIVMILPRQGSLSCWTSRQTYDAAGEMSRHSETFSILQSRVTPYLHQLVDEVTYRQLHWQSVSDCLLRTLVALLHRELQELPAIHAGDDGIGEFFKNSRPEAHAISKAEEYIRANLRWPLTIDQVARAVYLSRTTFTQQFRARTGKTFTQYVNDCRFAEACRLLERSDLSIQHISLQLGIKERGLRLLIQQRVNLSPTALRCRLREGHK